MLVFGTIGFLPADPEEEPPKSDLARARVFAGYAGWGPGQLEESLPSRPGSSSRHSPTMYSPAIQTLWSVVLRRKGGAFKVLSTMPADPSLN